MKKDYINTIQLVIIILVSFLLNTSSSLANGLESITSVVGYRSTKDDFRITEKLI